MTLSNLDSHHILVVRRPDRILYPSLLLLGLGIFGNIWADTGYAFTSAIGVHDSMNFLIDPMWYLGFLLMGLSSLYQYIALVKRANNEQQFPPGIA